MNAKLNFDFAKNVATKGYLTLRKVSPELALAGSIVCGIGAVVATIAVSKKVTKEVDIAKAKLDIIEKTAEKAEQAGEPIDKKEIHQKSWKAINKSIWKIAKILAPALGLEVASVVLMLLSHGILKNRYLNTTEALASLTAAFNGYRGRVKEALGEDAEKILMAGGKTEKNIKIEDDEGNITKKASNSIVIQEHDISPYEFNYNQKTAPLTWSPDPDRSEAYLRNTQNYFNDLLQTRGHVFLNEVLDQLGLKRTPAGAVCGWIKGAGDDYIDFGYIDGFIRDYKIDSDLCKKNIHLNFNVDGQIWDLI